VSGRPQHDPAENWPWDKSKNGQAGSFTPVVSITQTEGIMPPTKKYTFGDERPQTRGN
jgi:hypothetical protein